MQPLISRVGYVLLLALFAAVPFHARVSQWFLYYRETAAAVFLILWFAMAAGQRKNYRGVGITKEMLTFVAFPFMLVGFAAFDSGSNLYGYDPVDASVHVASVGNAVYVLRNAVLYVPMVLYIAARKLTIGEVRGIALVTALIAPLAVVDFLQRGDIASWKTLGAIAATGGADLAYNTFVPYLTFPALSAMFLIAADKRLVIRAAAIGVLIILTVYILFSTSRQSFVFLVVAGVVFVMSTGKRHLSVKFLVVAAVCGATAAVFSAVAENFYVNEKVFERFGSASGMMSTPRWTIAKSGLALLSPMEYITGAGLGSVVSAGPHNDYVRWTQRVGIFVAVLGFFPFMAAASKSFGRARRFKGDPSYVYVALAVGFTLYHSMFGYPRDDAFQAPHAFLGLALWFGLARHWRQRTFRAVQLRNSARQRQESVILDAQRTVP